MSTALDASDGPARLGEADLFGLAPAKLLEAARDYVLLGRVRRPRRLGPLLAAEVEGTDDTYPVRATLLPSEGGTPRITPACPCPSQRPHCKHVLALLWQWVDQPESFRPVDAWRGRLATRTVGELADLLASAAMGLDDPLALVQGAAEPPDWEQMAPGECLEQWEAFVRDARAAGRWPEAALALGRRIAGAPGEVPEETGLPAALSSRQLSWWLTRMAPELPVPALGPWVAHLRARLEAAAASGDRQALPPELGVWLARLAAALPEEHAAARRWLARFCAGQQALGPVCVAELQRLRWTEEVGLRLAVSPASVSGEVAGSPAARCQQALAAMEAEAAHR